MTRKLMKGADLFRGRVLPTTAIIALFLWALTSLSVAREETRFLTEKQAVADVLTILDERMAAMPHVAAWRWRNHLVGMDSNPRASAVDDAVALGGALGLSDPALRQVLKLQVDLGRKVQKRLLEMWRREGFSVAQPDRRPSRELQAFMDALTPRLVRALYLAAPAFEQENFSNDYATQSHALLAHELWTDEARSDTLAALSQIRLSSEPSLEHVRASGVLRVGATGDYPPFSSDAGGVLAGADIDLAIALAEAMGVDAVFVRTTWPSLIRDMRQKRFDIAMSGITITPERTDAGLFSVPYYTGGKTIIARCADANRYTSLVTVDRRNVRVIVNPGGSNEAFVRANIRHANIRVFPDNRLIFEQISAGRADVMITDDIEVELQTRRNPDLCRAMDGTLTHGEKAVFVTPDAALKEAIDDRLGDAIENGLPAALLAAEMAHMSKPAANAH